MKLLSDILDQDDPDKLWSDIVDLIVQNKDEKRWSRFERNVVVLSGLNRWTLNGGFKSYLCMPSGAYTLQARRALRDLGSSKLLDAFDLAISVFQGIRVDDYITRQDKILTTADEETLSSANSVYFSASDHHDFQVAEYIRANKSKLKWINQLPPSTTNTPLNTYKLEVYIIEDKPWWKFWRRPKRTLINNG